MNIEKFYYEIDNTVFEADAPMRYKGRKFMEQIDQSVIDEFMQEVEILYNAYSRSGEHKKVDNVSYSQVYADPKTDMATIMVQFERSNKATVLDYKYYKFELNAVEVVDCISNIYEESEFSKRLTKAWREILLKHFREQVTPYLKAEKERKRKQIKNNHQELEAEQAELDNEFNIGGIKI